MVASSSSTVCCTLEELLDLEKNHCHKRAQWVMNPPDPRSLWRQVVDNVKDTVLPRPNFSPLNNQPPPKRLFLLLQHLFPILGSFQNYNANKFKNNLMSDITLASLSMPQSMGNATLADLSPQYGLYTSIVPPLLYALLATSREIVIRPVAVDSLLFPQ